MPDNPKLSVVVPMYNEEEVIGDTVQRIKESLEVVPDWELILVNDGSTDRTIEAANRAMSGKENVRLVSYAINRGRGKALREGFRTAVGEIIVTIECDLSYNPSHILVLYRELANNPEVDMILGSAYMEGGRAKGVPAYRLAISKYGNKLLSYSFGAKLKTLTSMLRGYRRRVIDSLELESDGKEIHLEILSKAIALNYLIREVPATLEGRKSGKSKFKFVSTASSHLFLSFAERPMLVFGLIGILLLLGGIVGGIYLIVLWQQGNLTPSRPLIILVALLILTGIQTLFFGFLSIQQGQLRREIFRLESQIKKNQIESLKR